MSCTNKNLGFTIVESLIVMSILGIISVAGIYKVINSQEKGALNDAQAAVVRLTESARNSAASGEGTQEHGIYIEQNGITIFEGNIAGGTKYFFHPAVESNQTDTEITFSRYSGSATTSESFPVTIRLSGNRGGESIIEINSEGAITVTE
ncbi:MAG: type II secretion system protein [Candidatus Spechtbacterales bacterium]|nr:type II secretion system protein [Candidatus Spechtbacterales bacterium]